MTPHPPPPAFDSWMAALEARHLATLRYPEVVRALRALSSTYVERRARLASRGSLDSDGKRAAFALYYGPLHWLLVRAILDELPRATRPARRLLDLGCGTGVAGAAWASALDPVPRVLGLDIHPWAAGEAAFTWRQFGIDGDARRGHVARAPWPRADAIVAAFVANELPAEDRATLLARLIEAARGGARVLVVEPLARGVAPWWPEWTDAVTRAGGRADEWRFAATPPPLVARLADSAGLRPDGVAGRSLWIDPH